MDNDSMGGFNPTFVFLAFSIVWVAIFGYVFYVARRQADVRNDLDDLRREVALGKGDGDSASADRDG
jgi:CcmD family protein